MFIPRTSNGEAPKLVGFGNSMGSRTWLDGVPNQISLDQGFRHFLFNISIFS